MDKNKKQKREEKIIMRLLSHSISLAFLVFFIWFDITKVGNLWALPLELFPSILISGLIEVCIFTDYENIDETIKKQDIKRKKKHDRMMKKQQKKEKIIQERKTAYTSYEEQKETLKETNTEVSLDIEENLESYLDRIESRKSEYISLLDLVKKYQGKQQEAKPNNFTPVPTINVEKGKVYSIGEK